ncbi:hypothetical protein GGX14DRAFT_398372 [Mycena pura]|uniref:Uncharacterized protein n=1 Tax=Mycena pura TaxID=153505 RepID=A0AAD6Y6G5_9AGAR|nr:hypothetical protein GGX14DRAFT_398372 [Mycena pura]
MLGLAYARSRATQLWSSSRRSMATLTKTSPSAWRCLGLDRRLMQLRQHFRDPRRQEGRGEAPVGCAGSGGAALQLFVAALARHVNGHAYTGPTEPVFGVRAVLVPGRTWEWAEVTKLIHLGCSCRIKCFVDSPRRGTCIPRQAVRLPSDSDLTPLARAATWKTEAATPFIVLEMDILCLQKHQARIPLLRLAWSGHNLVGLDDATPTSLCKSQGVQNWWRYELNKSQPKFDGITSWPHPDTNQNQAPSSALLCFCPHCTPVHCDHAAEKGTGPSRESRSEKILLKLNKTLAQERKAENRAKIISGEDIPAPLDLKLEDITLGYAKFPILAHLLKGENTPEIVPGPYDRKPEMQPLINLRRIGPDGLQPHLFIHAIILAVKRTDIDLASLTTDIKAPLQMARFVGDDHRSIKLLRIAGQHRTIYMAEVYATLLKMVAQAEAKGSDKRGATEELHRAKQTIRENITWSVQLVDWDMAMSEKCADLLWFISSNNQVQAVSDEEEHSLVSLYKRFRIKLDGEAAKARFRATSMGLTGLGAFVSRHFDVLEVMARVHEYKGFDDNMVESKQLEKLKISGWGAFALIVQALFTDFVTLIMPLVQDPENHNQSIQSQGGYLDADSGPLTPMGNLLIPVFDTAFKDMFLEGEDPAFDYFGFSNSPRYNEAYEKYIKEVLKGFPSETGTPGQKQILTVIRGRLENLLQRDSTEYPHPPILCPLLCPSLLVKLADLIITLEPAFSMMSHVCGPGRLEYAIGRSTKNRDVIPSLSCRLVAHLRHFEDVGLKPDWAWAEVNLTNTSEAVKLVANALMMRATTLSPPVLGLFQATLEKRIDSKDYLMEENLQSVLTTIKNSQDEWQIQGQKARQDVNLPPQLTKYQPRNLQHFPESLMPQHSKMAAAALRILGHHSIDHLVPGNPNAKHTRKRLASQAVHELEILERFIKPMFEQNNLAENFRQMLSQLMTHDDNDVKTMEVMGAKQASSQALNAAFNSIVNILGRQEQCTVPVPMDKLKGGKEEEVEVQLLDPRLKAPLEALLKHSQAMRAPKSTDPTPNNTDEWTIGGKSTKSFIFKFATLDNADGDGENEEDKDEDMEKELSPPPLNQLASTTKRTQISDESDEDSEDNEDGPARKKKRKEAVQ